MRKLLPKMGFDATLVDNGGAVIDACCALAPGTDGAWPAVCAVLAAAQARTADAWPCMRRQLAECAYYAS